MAPIVHAAFPKIFKGWQSQHNAHPEHCHRGHHRWPGYTGTGHLLDVRLTPQAYTASELLTHTIPCFYDWEDENDSNLTLKQLNARKEIVKMISDYTVMKACLGDYQQVLTSIMQLLDSFFFFGALCRERIHVRLLKPSVALLSKSAEELLGEFNPTKRRITISSCDITMTDRCSATTNPIANTYNTTSGTTVGMRMLSSLVHTLIHEMCHAYLSLYLCPGPVCTSNIRNTTGFWGHGPAFQVLYDCATQTMARWLPSSPPAFPRLDDEIRCMNEEEHDNFERLVTAAASTAAAFTTTATAAPSSSRSHARTVLTLQVWDELLPGMSTRDLVGLTRELRGGGGNARAHIECLYYDWDHRLGWSDGHGSLVQLEIRAGGTEVHRKLFERTAAAVEQLEPRRNTRRGLGR
ncbi:hypothetical protein BX600DRAFT_145771 [Xylariales sp. PMI_506]|nr:hypothetical protein BX600DRAFT_145771 [Xylariales sp. PMI_506]